MLFKFLSKNFTWILAICFLLTQIFLISLTSFQILRSHSFLVLCLKIIQINPIIIMSSLLCITLLLRLTSIIDRINISLWYLFSLTYAPKLIKGFNHLKLLRKDSNATFIFIISLILKFYFIILAF